MRLFLLESCLLPCLLTVEAEAQAFPEDVMLGFESNTEKLVCIFYSFANYITVQPVNIPR